MRLRNHDNETIDVSIIDHHRSDGFPDGFVVHAHTGRQKYYKDTRRALTAFHAAMHAALAKGYVLEHEGTPIAAPPPTTFRAFPALEAPVEAELDLEKPGDEDALLVLGDAWASAGDPRGDGVLGERVLTTITDPTELVRQKELLVASRAASDAHVLGRLGSDAYRVQVEYQRGLVTRLRLPLELAAPGRTTVQLVRELFANPFVRFVRELDINACPAAVIAEVGASRAPLRILQVFSREAVELAPLDSLTHLKHLEVFASRVTFSGHLATLQHCAVVGPTDVDAVVAWMKQHTTLEGLVLSARATPALEAFMAEPTRWPAQLRRVQVGQLVRSR